MGHSVPDNILKASLGKVHSTKLETGNPFWVALWPVIYMSAHVTRSFSGLAKFCLGNHMVFGIFCKLCFDALFTRFFNETF